MQGQTRPPVRKSAARLRRSMTEAERTLWQRLRREQLGVKFRRQHPFEHYILDFVCLERKLIIEVDGSQHAQALPQDAARTAALEAAGFRVLRFWNNEVLQETDAVLERIVQALHPSPSCPSP